jgi:hypothetical protein
MSALDRDDWLVERLENLAMDVRNNDRIDFTDEAAEAKK